MSPPSIACIGIIGKHDNPLHIAIFPPYGPPSSSINPSPSPDSDPASNSSSSSESTNKAYARNHLDFSFLLNASLDIFDARARDKTRIDQDLGLLQHVDERLSLWGWLTGTGVKFVVVIDAWGKDARGGLQQQQQRELERSGTGSSVRSEGGKKDKGGAAGKTVGDADLRPAFKALQTAYIRLLQNPFYVPDEHNPTAVAQGRGKGGQITSKKFLQEVRRIGDIWKPGLSTV